MDSLSKFLRGIFQGTLYRNSTTEVAKDICEDIFKDFPHEFLMELPKGYSKEFFKDCCREFSQTFLRNSLLNWLWMSLDSSLRKPPVI